MRLENQATVLIADHVRKDAPPGSLSWRFVELSVKNGKLEEPGRHIISPGHSARTPAAASAAAVSRPSGGARNWFTKEDDDILTKHVIRQERQHMSVRGNKIYQELAAKVSEYTCLNSFPGLFLLCSSFFFFFFRP